MKREVECKETFEELQVRLDNLLAAQCYFCSPQFIEGFNDIMTKDVQEADLWKIESKLDNFL